MASGQILGESLCGLCNAGAAVTLTEGNLFQLLGSIMRTAFLACLLSATTCLGQSPLPTTIPFQGRLMLQSGSAVNSVVALTFRVYDSPTQGNPLWNETHNAVSVNQGLFKVELGSVTGFGPAVFSGKTLYLGVQIGTDPEMTPRLTVSSQALRGSWPGMPST